MPTKQSDSYTSDDAILKEIRENFAYFSGYWKDNYDWGDEDIKCLTSKTGPWPEAEVKARKDAKIPCPHQDILTQYIIRIVNQGRLNQQSIKINPTGEGASEETAERREKRIRQIEYECNAGHARLWALECAVKRGIGFYEVSTEFVRPDSFNQRIIVNRIPNSKSVLYDPRCKRSDRSDAKAVFKFERMSKAEFLRKWDESQLLSFSPDELAGASQFISDHEVVVVKYWCVKFKKRRLLRFQAPEGSTEMFLDELPGAKVRKAGKDKVLVFNGQQIPVELDRVSDFPSVHWYISNGVEILDRDEWIGTTIPVIMVTGVESYDHEGKLIIESATRKGIPAQMQYDYALANEQESLGMIPKAKVLVAAGSIEEFEEWKDAHRNRYPYLRYKVVADGVPVPAPIIIDHSPDIQGYEIAKQAALIAAQNAMGMSSIERKDRVAKSGKALSQLDLQQDVATFHFPDNSKRGLEMEGRIINELLAKIEDTDTIRGFRSSDGEYETARVTPMKDPQSGEIVQHPYGKSEEHDVTVDVTKPFQSAWQEAEDFLNQLAGNEAIAPAVLPLVVKMKQLGPLGDKLVDVLKSMMPPQARAAMDGKPAEPQIPPQVGQMIQQLTEQLNQAKNELAHRTAELDNKMAMNEQNNITKIAVAEIGAKVSHQAEVIGLFTQKMDHILEMILQQNEHAHAADQQSQQLGAQQSQADQGAQLQREQMAQQAQQQPTA